MAIRLHRAAWVLPLVALGLLVPAYLLARASIHASACIYLGAAFGGAGALVLAAFRQRERLGIAWRLCALGFAVWACGDLAWLLHDAFGVRTATRPLEDGLYLATYPFLTGALLSMLFHRRVRVETVIRQLLDTAVLFVSGFCVFWIYYGDGVLAEHEHALSLVYPLLDLVNASLVARLVFGSGRWPVSYRLLALSLGLVFGADLVWRITLADGTYSVNAWINTLYMAAYLCGAAAALHPSAPEVEGFVRSAEWADRGSEIWRRLIVLAAVAAAPGTVLLLAFGRLDDWGDKVVFATSVILIPLLVLARGADLVRTLRHVAAESDAAGRRTAAIIEANPLAISVVDMEARVCGWNAAAERLTGHARSDVLGKRTPVVPWENPDRIRALLAAALAGVQPEALEERFLARDGTPVDVRLFAAGLSEREVVVMWEDVTRERQHAAELYELARTDPLTGLPNLLGFEEELAAAERSGVESAWIVRLDIDNFRSVNDTVGQRGGDEVLREVAAILRSELPAGGFLARFSGDEFAVVIPDFETDVAAEVAERLIRRARDFRLLRPGVQTVDLTMSGGIAQLAGAVTAETALARADDALHEAKRFGKNRLERWSPAIEAGETVRVWSPTVKDALADDRIELFLQPIVPLDGAGTQIFEALCRLRMPDGALVGAAEFIEAAEELGLIGQIDRVMLAKAAAVVAEHDGVRIFVNVSAQSFNDRDFLELLEDTVVSSPAQSLGIEITERTALGNPVAAAVRLSRLIEAGAVVAIDDFGLGFTSFSELASLPCHLIKIPAELADTSRHGVAADTVAWAITDVAHAYGKGVVIEGVETAEGDARARALGIEYGQGWHYGRPERASSVDLVARPDGGRLMVA